MSDVPIVFNQASMFNDAEREAEDGSWYRHDLPAGTAAWLKWHSRDEIACLQFTCPCGCGLICTCTVSGNDPGPRWSWDGNIERPTLKPSINIRNEHWHGWLTDGVFRR